MRADTPFDKRLLSSGMFEPMDTIPCPVAAAVTGISNEPLTAIPFSPDCLMTIDQNAPAEDMAPLTVAPGQ